MARMYMYIKYYKLILSAMSPIQCFFRWTSFDFFGQALWLIMAFISLFIYYFYFILFI